MNKQESGSSHIVVVIVLVVIVVIGLVGWRVLASQNNTTTTNDARASNEPAPSLQNVGLANFDSSIDYTTQATREYQTMGLKGFYVFGDKLPGNRLNPNFEFASVTQGTPIISAIDGVVTFIKEQPETGDSEVMVQPKEGSAWTIGYDHLTNLNVTKGQAVKVGQTLGQPSVQNNGLYRFEFQVNKGDGDNTMHYCPSTLLAANVKQQTLDGLSTMQTKWETTTGLDLYDLAAQNPIGCLVTTLTPARAEGR